MEFWVAIICSCSNALKFKKKINKQLVFWIGTRLHAHNVLILNFCWDTYWTAGNITGIFNANPIEQRFNRIEHSNAQLLIDIFENIWQMEVAFLTFNFFKNLPLLWCACKRHNTIMIGIFFSSLITPQSLMKDELFYVKKT